MPYSHPFIKVNIRGHFGPNSTTKTEQWQAGFHITKNGGLSATSAEILTFLTAISTDINTFHVTGNVAAGTLCFLDDLTGALIGTDGKYVLGTLQNTTIYTYVTPIAGSGSIQTPWATATALTLRSLLLRGPGSHGRIFYPTPATSITSTTGVIASGTVAGLATAAQTLLNAINTKATAAFGSSAGVGLVSPIGTGFQSPVVQLWVGAKPDHIESRERNVLEAYTIKTLTVSAALEAQRNEEMRDKLDDLLDVD